MTIEEDGLSDLVLDTLAQFLDRNPSDIKARYEISLKREKTVGYSEKVESEVKGEDIFLDKDLDAALDSFDNLFCRRCLIFDCRLHGCSQDLVFPVEIKRTIPKSSAPSKDIETKKFFVGGIPTTTHEDELKNFFSKYR